MKLAEFLYEAPLADISFHSTDQPGSFTAAEKKIIDRYITTGEYSRKLKAVPFDLYVYFIDNEVLGEIGKSYPEKEIPKSIWKYQDAPVKDFIDDNIDATDFPKAVFKTVFKLIREIDEKDPGGVHFIMGDNFSATNQIAPTPWMIAHRLSHALINPSILDDLKMPTLGMLGNTTPIYITGFLINALTMKSAVTGNLDEDEANAEMFTQYLLTGDIPLNLKKMHQDFREFIDKQEKAKLFSEEEKQRFHRELEKRVTGYVKSQIDSYEELLAKMARNGTQVYYI